MMGASALPPLLRLFLGILLSPILLYGCSSSGSRSPRSPALERGPEAEPSSGQRYVFTPSTWKEGSWPFTLKKPAILRVNGRQWKDICIATATDWDGNTYTLNGIAASNVTGPTVYNIDKITDYSLGSARPLLDAALEMCGQE